MSRCKCTCAEERVNFKGLCAFVEIILPSVTSILLLIFLFLLGVICLASGLLFSIVGFSI